MDKRSLFRHCDSILPANNKQISY
ncbi:hypothetical protein EMIT0P43_30108 [Pseudomonas jessenii]